MGSIEPVPFKLDLPLQSNPPVETTPNSPAPRRAAAKPPTPPASNCCCFPTFLLPEHHVEPPTVSPSLSRFRVESLFVVSVWFEFCMERSKFEIVIKEITSVEAQACKRYSGTFGGACFLVRFGECQNKCTKLEGALRGECEAYKCYCYFC